ncbi:MAG: hypothetical protein GF315_06485 [candidate division Zixibacteria bacterium]|nr:hypothetical protein [candidate division Zixibacteria bacterium]
MQMKVAIPKFNDMVAPCFEAAASFCIAEIDADGIVAQKVVTCSGVEGYRRIRLVKIYDIEALICNGIKEFYEDLLSVSGVTVYPGVSGSIDEALKKLIDGKLKPFEYKPDNLTEIEEVSHSDLLQWAKEAFESNGYKVSDGPGQDSFLIDLVAELSCPVCGKQIRVAICCGAHTYRYDQEIGEFHHIAKSGYNARVYIHSRNPDVAQYCEQYGIELLDPKINAGKKHKTRKIPLLQRPVAGHEKAFAGLGKL